jgi:hypothetical protein
VSGIRTHRTAIGAGGFREPVRNVAIGTDYSPSGNQWEARAMLASTASLRSYLVDQDSASWNRITNWLRRVEALRKAA